MPISDPRPWGPNLHPDPQYTQAQGVGWWFGNKTSSLPAGLPAEYTSGGYIDYDGEHGGSLGFLTTGVIVQAGIPMAAGAWVKVESDPGWDGHANVRLAMVTDDTDWTDYDYLTDQTVQEADGWTWVEWVMPSPLADHRYPSLEFNCVVDTAGGAPGTGKVRVYATGVEIRQQVRFADAVMALSPHAYYKMNETSGNTMADSSGAGRNGIFNSTTSTYPGPSLVLSDPGGTGRTIVSSTSTVTAQGISVDATSSTHVFTYQGSGTGDWLRNASAMRAVVSTVNGLTSIQWIINSASTTHDLGINILDDIPHMLAFVAKPTGTEIWVDGVLRSSKATAPGAGTYTSIPLKGTTTNGPAGNYDDWAIYTTPLTQAQIEGLYEAWIGGGQRATLTRVPATDLVRPISPRTAGVTLLEQRSYTAAALSSGTYNMLTFTKTPEPGDVVVVVQVWSASVWAVSGLGGTWTTYTKRLSNDPIGDGTVNYVGVSICRDATTAGSISLSPHTTARGGIYGFLLGTNPDRTIELDYVQLVDQAVTAASVTGPPAGVGDFVLGVMGSTGATGVPTVTLTPPATGSTTMLDSTIVETQAVWGYALADATPQLSTSRTTAARPNLLLLTASTQLRAVAAPALRLIDEMTLNAGPAATLTSPFDWFTPRPSDVMVVVESYVSLSDIDHTPSGFGATWTPTVVSTEGTRQVVWIGRGATSRGSLQLTTPDPSSGVIQFFILRGLTPGRSQIFEALPMASNVTTYTGPATTANAGEYVVALMYQHSSSGSRVMPSAATPALDQWAGTDLHQSTWGRLRTLARSATIDGEVHQLSQTSTASSRHGITMVRFNAPPPPPQVVALGRATSTSVGRTVAVAQSAPKVIKRFYLSSAAPAVSPATGAGWVYHPSYGVVRGKLTTTAAQPATGGGTDFATTGGRPKGATGRCDTVVLQLVSDPLAGGVVGGGLLDTVIAFGAISYDPTMWLHVKVRVISGDGADTRGVVYEGPGGAAASTVVNSNTQDLVSNINRRLDDVVTTAVTALAGDRLVVEYGYSSSHSQNWSNASMRYGAHVGYPDMSFDNTVYQGLTHNAWVDIPMEAPPAQTIALGRATSTSVARAVSVVATAPPSAQSYSAVVLADSPLAYYRLGDASSTLLDTSGNARNGTWAGYPSANFTLGSPGLDLSDPTNKAGLFHPQSVMAQDGPRVPYAAWMATGHASVEALIKMTALPASGEYLMVAGRDDNGSNLTTRLDIGSDGKVRFIFNRGGYKTATSTTALTPGVAYHLVGTFDGTGGRLYVNGVQEAFVAAAGTLSEPGAPQGVEIGHMTTGLFTRSPFQGTLDEVAFYGTALSGSRVAAHYTAATTVVAGPAQTIALGRATSLSVTRPVTLPPRTVALGKATSISTVRPLTRLSPLTQALGRTTAPSVARVLTVVVPAAARTVPLGKATSLHTARALTYVGPASRQVTLGRVTETGTVRLVMVIASPPPVVTPPGEPTGGGTATIRWKLRDTATGVEWTMPINPDSMSSPFPRRVMKFGYGWRRDHRVRTVVTASEAQEWEWSGVIRSKDHYDRLVEWAGKSVAIDVTDHLGRTFRVFIEEFNPVDRRPTPRVTWRLRYTMKARVLERVG